MVDDELVAAVHFRFRDLGPVDHLKPLAGVDEGKDLYAERRQDNIGMPDTMVGEPEEEDRKGERKKSPPPGEEGSIGKEAAEKDRDGGEAEKDA